MKEETRSDLSTPSTRQAIRRLLVESVIPLRKLFIGSLICMLAVAGFTAALAWSTKLIVNEVFVAANASAAIGVALLVIGVSLGKSLSQYVNSILSVQINRKVAIRYQKQVFRKFLFQNVQEFAGIAAPRHMAKVNLWGSACGQVVLALTNKFLTDILTLIALVGVMIWQDPVMSLVTAVLFPLIFFLVSNLTRRVRELSKAQAELAGNISTAGIEAISGIKTVKSYGLEEKSFARFSDAVAAMEKRLYAIARATSATVPLMELLGGICIGLFVIYASWQTLSQGKTPGEFTAFITAFLLAYQPAERITKTMVAVQRNLVHVEDMFAFLDQPDPNDSRGEGSLDDVAPSITFEDVSFEYDASSPALHGVQAAIKPGERVAIVGRSGAGKTTLVDLVQGFYPPTSGRILIGGVDINTIPEAELRRHVALISQDVFLFEGSLRDNIADGRADATPEEITDAADRAAVSGFAAQLEKGLDTPVGPNGTSLSGGQKQRVGIARALVKQAKVYIYDEATSALDGENERAIMKATLGRESDSTILFITHRPSTLEWVDRIMVMKDGKLVAFGAHEELVESSKAYRSLFNLAVEQQKKAKGRYGRILGFFQRNTG
ncbi:ABC transporter ATP-binding protein [Poseidonocella sedimentorum]|uniref:ATP-binding cassette, subfamily B n=1 Tax=Poseidonocella sedimentorum TaxID=871652 RepID=A0A1I6D487_9RHOB|nr:ABC transporter ATP-binding protein [Poseidonocella sedimentorum]SFR00308.1 ATP-binding cassette, subfamily B [Poseidonocella sedimentorum]